MVAPCDEAILRDRLVSSNMAVWLDEQDVERRPDGRLLLGGLFGVAHKSGQRAIFDQRPFNPGELRPLADGVHAVRDDLVNYFYQLEEAACMLKRRAFGRVLTGPEAAARGLDPARRYRLALRVLGMGGIQLPGHCPVGPRKLVVPIRLFV